MKLIPLLWAVAIVACIAVGIHLFGCVAEARPVSRGETIGLPAPSRDSDISIEQALSQRRSVREFRDEPPGISDVSQLLWAAQGVTGADGLRTAPSAGALYPLEVYVVAGNVRGLEPGVYKYLPREHAIIAVARGDKRADLALAAPGQPVVKDAAIDIVIAGVYERTTGKYDTPLRDTRTGSSYPAGVKYAHMEAGHAAQNVYLQSVSRGLGTVAVGAFSEAGVRDILGMPGDERPLYLMPVGRA